MPDAQQEAIRVLVFEDDLSSAAVSRLLGELSDPGVFVTFTTTPRLDESLRQDIGRIDPTLILVDLDLGSQADLIRFEGFSLLRELADDPLTKNIPVVVWSIHIGIRPEVDHMLADLRNVVGKVHKTGKENITIDRIRAWSRCRRS